VNYFWEDKMATYVYTGRVLGGGTKKGVIEAPDLATARAMLRRQRIIPSSVKEKSKGLEISLFQQKITENDLMIFTRQFSTMIESGLPLIQGLDILASQHDNKAFKAILTQVKEDVEKGSTFADALKKHPKIFDDLFVNLVAAGEVGGILDTILKRLAAYIEKAHKLKKRVKGAMFYPASIVTVAVVVIIVLLYFVVPTFKSLFESFGAALPTPTQIVINLSDLMKKYILYVIIGMVALFFAFRRYYKTENGRKVIDTIMLKLPVFGPLLRKVAVARFTRTLGTMLSSGVPILDALDIVAKTAGNKVLEEAIYKTKQRVSEGKSLVEPLEESGVFPPMVTRMIAVGEATGALDSMLSKIADFYDEEVDAAVEALTSLMEPMLMVFLGVIIGGLVVAMYLPIFKLGSVIGGG